MHDGKNKTRWRAIPDTEALAPSWDGPYFQLFRCGLNDFHQTPPSHAMFLDAMVPCGCWEYVLQGRVIYRLHNKDVPVEAGQALVSRRPEPGWLLRPVEQEPVQTLWLEVRGECAMEVFDYLHGRFGQVQSLAGGGSTVQRALELVRLVHRQQLREAAFWSERVFKWLNSWWREMEARPQRVCLAAVQASRLVSYEPQTIANFAAKMGYSRAYMALKLKQQWTRSPGVVLRETRLQDAARLLRTTRLSVAEVGRRVGYVSAAAFGRAFVTKYASTPRRYRQEHR